MGKLGNQQGGGLGVLHHGTWDVEFTLRPSIPTCLYKL